MIASFIRLFAFYLHVNEEEELLIGWDKNEHVEDKTFKGNNECVHLVL